MSARRKRGGGEGGGDSGSDTSVVLFTALGLILLALFIMLNTMADIDPERAGVAIDSLFETFGVLPGFRRDDAGYFSEYDNIRRAAEMREMLEEVMDGTVEGAVEISEREGRPVIILDPDVAFEPGGVALSPLLFRSLNGVARIVRETGMRIRIEGHANATGSERVNWRLSTGRAVSLYRYLRDAGRVPAAQMTAQGYGASRPRDNGLPAADGSHRRVEIVFLIEGEDPR